MTATLTHRCLRGRHCASRESTPDGAHQGAATEAPEALCRTCERRAGHTIGDLPALYTELETIIGQHGASGEHVSGTREPPIPPRLDVIALQGDVDAVLSMWAAPLARRCRITWDTQAMRQLRAGPRVTRAAHLLASNLDALLRLPATRFRVWKPDVGVIDVHGRGVDAALELVALHTRGRHLVTGGAGHSRLPVPCPSCEAPALVRANGADQVDCRACGRYWPESDYRRLCLILADDYQRRPAA